MTRDVALGTWFWMMQDGEAHGVAAAAILSRSPLLRPEERDFAGDRLLPDERGHRRMFGEMAAGYPRPSLAHQFPDLASISHGEILMRLTRAEADLLRHADEITAVVGAAGRCDFREMIAQVIREEFGHRLWGIRIVHRLRNDGVSLPSPHLLLEPRRQGLNDLMVQVLRPEIAT